jgi:3'-phosphoadenosine 5'-phosphosulfate (PAPS) 3'-phosphatase
VTIAPSPFMRQLIDLAHEAGRAVMAIYEQDFGHRMKDDATPVTDADLAAEAVILAGLARIAPDIPVISEEAAAAGAESKTGEKFFLVDPLDGTREFLSRNGEFTINIALIERASPWPASSTPRRWPACSGASAGTAPARVRSHPVGIVTLSGARSGSAAAANRPQGGGEPLPPRCAHRRAGCRPSTSANSCRPARR